MSTSSSFLNTQHSFHAIYSTHFSINESPPSNEHCNLHIFYVLPPSIFVDPYELAHYSAHYSFALRGTRNLELPVLAVSPEGSQLLLQVLLPEPSSNVAVNLPIHARYGNVGAHGYETVLIPKPTSFWACPSNGELSI